MKSGFELLHQVGMGGYWKVVTGSMSVSCLIAPKISRHSFDTWIKPTRGMGVKGNVVYVRVPTPEFQHIGEKYGDLIQEVLKETAPEFRDVQFITRDEQ